MSDEIPEVSIDFLGACDTPVAEEAEALSDAFDNASDQDRMTWVTRDGKRIAAIVTVEDGEECAIKYEPEPPHDENHYRHHSPAQPMEGCAVCRHRGWLR